MKALRIASDLSRSICQPASDVCPRSGYTKTTRRKIPIEGKAIAIKKKPPSLLPRHQRIALLFHFGAFMFLMIRIEGAVRSHWADRVKHPSSE
jgi:hypothetical protein